MLLLGVCFFLGGFVAFLLKGCGFFWGVGGGGFVYYFCFFFPYRHFPNIDITVNKSMLGVSLNKTNNNVFTIIKNKKQKQNIKLKASGERLTESGFTSTFRAVLRHTLFMGQSSGVSHLPPPPLHDMRSRTAQVRFNTMTSK